MFEDVNELDRITGASILQTWMVSVRRTTASCFYSCFCGGHVHKTETAEINFVMLYVGIEIV